MAAFFLLTMDMRKNKKTKMTGNTVGQRITDMCLSLKMTEFHSMESFYLDHDA